MRIGILRQACPSASSFFSTRLSVVLVVPNSIAHTLMGGSCAPAAAAARLVLNAGKCRQKNDLASKAPGRRRCAARDLNPEPAD